MAAGDVLGTKKCRCTGQLTYREGKSGSISGACDTCKRQTFDRSPAAVNALKADLARRADPKGGGLVKGEAFDLTKL